MNDIIMATSTVHIEATVPGPRRSSTMRTPGAYRRPKGSTMAGAFFLYFNPVDLPLGSCCTHGLGCCNGIEQFYNMFLYPTDSKCKQDRTNGSVPVALAKMLRLYLAILLLHKKEDILLKQKQQYFIKIQLNKLKL